MGFRRRAASFFFLGDQGLYVREGKRVPPTFNAMTVAQVFAQTAREGSVQRGKPLYAGRTWTQVHDEMIDSGARVVGDLPRARVRALRAATEAQAAGVKARTKSVSRACHAGTLGRCRSAPTSATSPSSPTSITARRRSSMRCSGSPGRFARTRMSPSGSSIPVSSSARRGSRSSPRTPPSATGR